MELHINHWPRWEGTCEVRPTTEDGKAAKWRRAPRVLVTSSNSADRRCYQVEWN